MEAVPIGATRPNIQTLPVKDRLNGFNLVEQTFDVNVAVDEARRCLSCDMRDYEVDVNFSGCKECGYCKEVCSPDIFITSNSFNSTGFKPTVAARTEKCVGCRKCLMVCPDFAISIDIL